MRSESALPFDTSRIRAAEALVATARAFQRELRALGSGLPLEQRLALDLMAEVGLHEGAPWSSGGLGAALGAALPLAPPLAAARAPVEESDLEAFFAEDPEIAALLDAEALAALEGTGPVEPVEPIEAPAAPAAAEPEPGVNGAALAAALAGAAGLAGVAAAAAAPEAEEDVVPDAAPAEAEEEAVAAAAPAEAEEEAVAAAAPAEAEEEVVADAAPEAEEDVVADAAPEAEEDVVADAAPAEAEEDAVADAAPETGEEAVADAAPAEAEEEAVADAAPAEAEEEVVADAAPAEAEEDAVADAAPETGEDAVADAAPAEAEEDAVAEAAPAEADEDAFADAAPAETEEEVVADAAPAETEEEVVADAAPEADEDAVADAAPEADEDAVADAAPEAERALSGDDPFEPVGWAGALDETGLPLSPAPTLVPPDDEAELEGAERTELDEEDDLDGIFERGFAGPSDEAAPPQEAQRTWSPVEELRSEDIFGARPTLDLEALGGEPEAGLDEAGPDDDGLSAADDTIPGAARAALGSVITASALGLDLAVGSGLEGMPGDEVDPDGVFGGAAGRSPFMGDDDPDEERTQLDMTVPIGALYPGLGEPEVGPFAEAGAEPDAGADEDEDEDATAQVSLAPVTRAAAPLADPFREEPSGGHTHRISGRPAAEGASGPTSAPTAQRPEGPAPRGRREPDTADAFAALSLHMPGLGAPQPRELGSAPLGREPLSREPETAGLGPARAAEASSARLRPEERSARAEAASVRAEPPSARLRAPEIHSAPLPPGARRGARPADPWASPEGSGPRVLEGEAPAPEPLGAAAIQILGIGKARTLSQTLELEGTGEEQSSEVWGEQDDAEHGDLAVSFEEPAEREQVRVPRLTDAPALPTAGPGLLTAEGIISTEAPPDTRSGIASTALRALLAEADEAARRGKLKEAVVLYGDALEHDPELLQGWLGRGRCLVDLSDYAAAMSDFTRAEDLAPEDPAPPFEMGNLFFARKEYGKSIAFYDNALQVDANHAPSLARRGSAHLHRKDAVAALADLQRAEKLDPAIPGIGRQVQLARNIAQPPKKKGGR